MNRKLLALSATIMAATLAVPSVTTAANMSKDSSVNTLVKGNTAFAVRLYRDLGASPGNLFFSPYSISSVLGMAYAGARENTAKEMKDVLELQLDNTHLYSATQHVKQEIQANAQGAGQKLRIANGLCLTGGQVSDAFRTILEENYDAEFFSGGVDKINGWVKRKTEGKIDMILEQLDPHSVCVLLNAIYFKGTWQTQFEKQATREGPFQLSGGKAVTVPFMYQKSEYRLLTKNDFQALELPYKNKAISMIILLPREIDGLTQLEEQLTVESSRRWLEELDEKSAREVIVFMPKFKLGTEYDLVPSCRELGIKDAFDSGGKADFRGLGWPEGELWISQIKHKAFVEVNEEGTEAAAATAGEMVTVSAPRCPIFRADHPFIFIIRDNTTGSILFMGRMADPSFLDNAPARFDSYRR
jgi:serpin B